jgi:lysophospholipase L1-like esterase
VVTRRKDIPIRRKVAWTALVLVLAACVAEGFNLGVGVIERAGWIDTHRQDARVSFVESDNFTLDPTGEFIVLSDYSNKHMATDLVVPVDKGGAWRIATTGGSLIRGMPYNSATTGAELPGTMQFWMRAWLTEGGDGRRYEVIDAGVSGQDSGRMAQMLPELLRMDPDVMVISAGNNEGNIPPFRILEFLHRQPAFRLAIQALLEEPGRADRPLWIPQDPETERITARFRHNLEAMIGACRQAGVPLVLVVEPINLRYTPRPSDPIFHRDPRDLWGACVWEGAEIYRHGQAAEALELLRSCEDQDAALLWIGNSLYELGRYDEARAILRQAVELYPLLRTRPSLNDEARRIAAASEGVVLVDVEAAVNAASPHGVPGESLFVDMCHLNWLGYAIMADAILTALDEHGLAPGFDPSRIRRTVEEVAAEAVLPELGPGASWLEGGRSASGSVPAGGPGDAG